MEQLANNPVTTLNGTINSSATTLTVTSAATFSTTGSFTILIGTELLRVTGVAGDVFTVTRGFEGTTAVTHANNSSVTQIVSSQVLANLFSEMYQVGVAASRPSSARAGTIYRASDMDYGWRYDGSNWDLIHPTYIPYANRINVASWTALNLGTSTWTDIHGVMRIGMPAGSASVRGYFKTIPTAPWTATIAIGISPIEIFRHYCGLALYDSVSGKLYGCAALTLSTLMGVGDPRWTNTTTVASSGNERRIAWGRYLFLRLIDDNTNWTFQFSQDNTNFTNFGQVARNTHLTPNSIAIHCSRGSGSPTHPAYFEMFGYWE